MDAVNGPAAAAAADVTRVYRLHFTSTDPRVHGPGYTAMTTSPMIAVVVSRRT